MEGRLSEGIVVMRPFKPVWQLRVDVHFFSPALGWFVIASV
jgi:hypothetical protein